MLDLDETRRHKMTNFVKPTTNSRQIGDLDAFDDLVLQLCRCAEEIRNRRPVAALNHVVRDFIDRRHYAR